MLAAGASNFFDPCKKEGGLKSHNIVNGQGFMQLRWL
jgi:hypothetical protein